ncbi:hypothetical protein WJX72_007487 [[Myrmecia] bisecta]|uniref:Uncharacterized protein n=1 Tax=[Myrmecia] bisecta TaxID=41462 RepID=A0AAW1Q2H4_9CHLO
MRGAVASAALQEGQASSHDLLIVGPGVLGSYLGKLWLDKHPGATVVGQTNTDSSHERLKRIGIQPRVKAEAGDEKYPYVIFCAPPSGSGDGEYVSEVKAAIQRWDGTGSFVFTSSGGLYTVDDGTQCNEDSAVVPMGQSDRNDRLLKAEQATLAAGGCVVRLVGLYHAQRGAHTFFLRMGKVPRWSGYTVNLIHYEDAASLSLAVLEGHEKEGQPFRSRTFVGCDGAPVTFQDMMNATLASGVFNGEVTFTGEEGPSKGKLMGNCRTREALHWRPKYPSFEDFMLSGAQDVYSMSDLFAVGQPHRG